MKCLIGHTGFVGGNLLRQTKFDACFNSGNIEKIRDTSCDLVVCAGVSATMWKANNDPEQDWLAIEKLLRPLRAAKISKLVLISTVAVFDNASAGYDEASAQYERTLPYGKHRRRLEEILIDEFQHVLVIRLPAIYGKGLKKNFIYDLLNPAPSFLRPAAIDEILQTAPDHLRAFAERAYRYDSSLDMYAYDRLLDAEDTQAEEFSAFLKANLLDARCFTNDQSAFQFYHLNDLWEDIELSLKHELRVVNFATEPVLASHVSECVSGEAFVNAAPPRISQDMRSLHAHLWGGENGYQANGAAVLKSITAFTEEEKRNS